VTTVIAVYNSDGCVGRCDARCHDAEGPDCDCICGGANHGRGYAGAVETTRERLVGRGLLPPGAVVAPEAEAALF
jgi:hypothetical protein